MLVKRSLGSTGLAVSILGLGTVKLGRREGVKYPSSFELPDDKQAKTLIALARERGINLIDTAPAYGSSESRLGTLLHGQRQHWIICSKVGEEFESGQSRFDFSPEHTRFSVDRSLKRLKTDVIDIVLVHSNGDDLDIINRHGTLDALAELKQLGKIRAFGMSTKSVEGGRLAALKSDVVMACWNLQHQDEIPVIDDCHALGKGVLIKKALASGHLSPGLNTDPVAATFNMIFAHPGVSSVVIGTIDPTHLLANIDRAQAAALACDSS